MAKRNHKAAAPELVEVELVVDYHEAEQICPEENPEANRIAIRFPRKATRFRPPVYHAAGASRRGWDPNLDPARRNAAVSARLMTPVAVTRMTRASRPG